MAVINPVITNHTKVTVDRNEACMSHYDKSVKNNIPRYNKVTVTYQTLKKDPKGKIILSAPVEEHLSGGQAHVFQHKTGHLNGARSDIYAEDFNTDSCLFLGDGPLTPDDVRNLYDDVEEAIIITKE